MYSKLKQVLFLFLILSIVVVSGCLSQETKTKVTVFKSSSCGCCGGYVLELERQGFDVETINTENMPAIKTKYSIPRSMESCHTAVIGDYFVEGHVPIEAVNKLLEEKPDIDGIALPDMPAGSPGMPGYKSGDWVIYSIKHGEPEEWMRL